MTGRERVRARKEAARKERIRQAKAAKRAKPGGLAGMGLNVGSLATATASQQENLAKAIEALSGNESRSDINAWMEGQEVPHE